MTAHQKPPSRRKSVRVGYTMAAKNPVESAQDREDAKSAARARRELKAGAFDGVSLDELEATIRRSD